MSRSSPGTAALSSDFIAALVYGSPDIPPDDPAEVFHEASKAYPSFAARQTRGATMLEFDPTLRELVRRNGSCGPHRRTRTLPRSQNLRLSLRDALRMRRSRRDFCDASLSLRQLSTVLEAGYGVTTNSDSPRRSVPSGGALYPLELYIFATRVCDLAPGVYHYDPHRHVLEVLTTGDPSGSLEQAMIFPEVARAAAFVAITAMFWRTRFKYGLRGYRFALLEAGHVGQCLLLAATALEVAAVPIGGFYDRKLEDLLAVDGVNESAIYGVALGPQGNE